MSRSITVYRNEVPRALTVEGGSEGVEISVGCTETLSMTPKQARILAAELMIAAEDAASEMEK